MSLYYIHKVGFQEMGSVGSLEDRPARGRYFLISKSCLAFFPHISSVVLNDKIVLSIIPMIEGAPMKKVYSTMDYHNQKFADIEYMGKNPRNEIRLYLNNELDPNKRYFLKDDYAVFEKLNVGEEVYYTLTKISPVDKHYEWIDRYVNGKDSRSHSNALFEKKLDFIKQPNLEAITDVIITDKATDVIKKETESVIDASENDVDEMGSSFFNSTLFRDLVMNAYHYECAITHKVIRYKDLFNLEAAHIKAQAHNGTFLPCNGIAMCRDMHFAFDKGFFTISDDYKVIVSEKLKGDWFYEEYNGKPIYVPKEAFYQPNKVFLAHHRKEVFNKFKQIRQITNNSPL